MTRLQIGPYVVETSNDEKVFFPADGITKGDVVAYFRDIAGVMLTHARERPLTLHRFPDGLGGEDFYQQQRPDYFPDYVGRCRAATASGDRQVERVVVKNQAGLVYLADQAAFVLHGWLATTEALDRPDRMIFDLDPPGEGKDFEPVREAARRVRSFLDELECPSFLMTTGSRGLHVVVPLDRQAGFDRSREVARDIAKRLAERHPDELTVAQRKDRRNGRLYLDVMRNARGQTAVLPYSLRARPGAPVATPLEWEELDRSDLGPRSYRIDNILRRLGQTEDPWKDIRRHAVGAENLAGRLQG